MAFGSLRREQAGSRVWFPWFAPVAAVVIATGGAACAAGAGGAEGAPAAEGGGTGGSGGAEAASGSGGAGGAGGDIFMTTGAGAGGPADGCTDAARPIYLLGQGNTLYRFDPPALALTTVGTVDCPVGGGTAATPFSMAVDRKGVAWVLYSNGQIFHVDVTTGACAATDYEPYQHELSVFGMGFATDEPGGQEETLYIADYFGSGIATISTDTLTVSPVRTYDALFESAELTGTGDGRLFGFFRGLPSVIAEIDPATGHILSQAPQMGVNIGMGWAFAFWGGDFYLATNPGGAGSKIERINLDTWERTTVVTGIPENIIGAGVSTCAPTEPIE